MILVELNYVEIGNRIAQRRIHAGIKQTNLAETVGISNNYLSSIERGKERPSLEILVSICNALHVTPDYLLMGNMHSNNIPQNITDGLDYVLRMTSTLYWRSFKSWLEDRLTDGIVTITFRYAIIPLLLKR